MRRVLSIVLGVAFLAGTAVAAENTEFKDQKEKASYSIGYQIGTDFRNSEMDLDPQNVARGLSDALKGEKPQIPEDEMHSTLMNIQREMQAKRKAQMEELGKRNKAEGEAFLAENAKKEGVKTLPSGLQYQVLKEGEGEAPKETDTVTVNYTGTLIDGTEFDSSYRRGQPATFQLNRVIPGWTEALQLMKPGAKWKIFVPANLAYGARGAGGKIGPNATLIFEVELLGVKGAKQAK